MDDDEFSLKIDEQVQSFLELKHKLTFFLITASIGSLGFTLAFSIERFGEISGSTYQSGCLYLGTSMALLAICAALGSLYYEIKSYQYHLRYRYEKRSWGKLAESEKTRWTKTNVRAGKLLVSSFVLLTVSVIAQSGVFVFELNKQEVTMHHYGEDSTAVETTEFGFDVVFRNKETGQEIKMYIPRSGVMEDPGRGLTLVKVREVADAIAAVLRHQLQ